MKSVIQLNDDQCFLCHNAYGTQWHHIFGGNPQRRYSEADGLKVRLCAECHCKVHSDPNLSGKLQLTLHRLGQTKWEALNGSREEFIARYGRNYLDD